MKDAERIVRQDEVRSAEDGEDEEEVLALLPPLETFFQFPAETGSLTGSIENDLIPSTPLTEEQLKRADSVLKEDLDLNSVPINQVKSSISRSYLTLQPSFGIAD